MAVVQRKLARSSKYANIFVFQRAYPARPDEIEFHGCVSTVKRYAVPLRCYSTTVCVRATFFPLSPRYARFSFFLSPANRKIVIRKNGSLKSGEMTNVVACFVCTTYKIRDTYEALAGNTWDRCKYERRRFLLRDRTIRQRSVPFSISPFALSRFLERINM